MTVSEIRARYKSESPEWVRDRMAELQVLEAQAERVKDKQSATIIGNMVSELEDHLRSAATANVRLVEPLSAPEPAPAPGEPEIVPPESDGPANDGLVLADMTAADIRQLNRHPLQKLAKANGISGRQTNAAIVKQLIEKKYGVKKAETNG